MHCEERHRICRTRSLGTQRNPNAPTSRSSVLYTIHKGIPNGRRPTIRPLRTILYPNYADAKYLFPKNLRTETQLSYLHLIQQLMARVVRKG